MEQRQEYPLISRFLVLFKLVGYHYTTTVRGTGFRKSRAERRGSFDRFYRWPLTAVIHLSDGMLTYSRTMEGRSS